MSRRSGSKSYLALICIVQIAVGGCIPRSVAQKPAASPYREVRPATMADYIRAVYRLNHEAAIAGKDEGGQLAASDPELAALIESSERNSGDLDAARRLAVAYLARNRYVQAHELLSRLQPQMPSDPEIQIGLARVWDAWREFDMARQHAENAVALEPQSVTAWDILGRVHLHAGRPEAATAALLSALEIDPQNAVLLANIGYTYMLASEWTRSADYFQRALAIDSTLGEASNNLAVVLVRLGEYDRALQQLMQTHPPAVALNNLGALYLEQQKPAEALRAFGQSLDVDPGYEKARDNAATARSQVPPPSIIYIPSAKPVAAAGSGSRPAEQETMTPGPAPATAVKDLLPLPGENFSIKVAEPVLTSSEVENSVAVRPQSVARQAAVEPVRLPSAAPSAAPVAAPAASLMVPEADHLPTITEAEVEAEAAQRPAETSERAHPAVTLSRNGSGRERVWVSEFEAMEPRSPVLFGAFAAAFALVGLMRKRRLNRKMRRTSSLYGRSSRNGYGLS